MSQSDGSVHFEQVFKDELEIVKTKRRLLNPSDNSEIPSNLFGITLSGGGIRSATINLGILEVFKTCGILKLSDYLSTVSDGGYTEQNHLVALLSDLLKANAKGDLEITQEDCKIKTIGELKDMFDEIENDGNLETHYNFYEKHNRD